MTVDDLLAHFDKLYPRANETVDGRVVRDNIDNMSSIGASLNEYEILPGIREFPTAGFKGKRGFYAADDWDHAEELADAIQRSNEISPIIVVEEKSGPYVLEGAHRMAAMVDIGAKLIPALIVVDLENFEDELEEARRVNANELREIVEVLIEQAKTM